MDGEKLCKMYPAGTFTYNQTYNENLSEWNCFLGDKPYPQKILTKNGNPRKRVQKGILKMVFQKSLELNKIVNVWKRKLIVTIKIKLSIDTIELSAHRRLVINEGEHFKQTDKSTGERKE